MRAQIPPVKTLEDGTRVVTDLSGVEAGRYAESHPAPHRVFVERWRLHGEFECRVVNRDDYLRWCAAMGVIPMGMLAASYDRNEPNGGLPDRVIAAAYGHGDAGFTVVVLDVTSSADSED